MSKLTEVFGIREDGGNPDDPGDKIKYGDEEEFKKLYGMSPRDWEKLNKGVDSGDDDRRLGVAMPRTPGIGTVRKAASGPSFNDKPEVPQLTSTDYHQAIKKAPRTGGGFNASDDETKQKFLGSPTDRRKKYQDYLNTWDQQNRDVDPIAKGKPLDQDRWETSAAIDAYHKQMKRLGLGGEPPQSKEPAGIAHDDTLFASTGLTAPTAAHSPKSKDKEKKDKEKVESRSLLRLYSLSEGNPKSSAKNAKDPETLAAALEDLQAALDDINASVPSLTKVVGKVLPQDIASELEKGLGDLEQGALRTRQTAKSMKGKVPQLQSDFEDNELLDVGDAASREFGTAKPKAADDGSDATKGSEKPAGTSKTEPTSKGASKSKPTPDASTGDDTTDDFRQALAAIQGDGDESPSSFLSKQKKDFLVPKSSQGVKDLLGTLPKDGKKKGEPFSGGDFPLGFQGAASKTGAAVDPVDGSTPVVGADGGAAWDPEDEKKAQQKAAKGLSTPGKLPPGLGYDDPSPSVVPVFSEPKKKDASKDDDDVLNRLYADTDSQPTLGQKQSALNLDVHRNRSRTQAALRRAKNTSRAARGK